MYLKQGILQIFIFVFSFQKCFQNFNIFQNSFGSKIIISMSSQSSANLQVNSPSSSHLKMYCEQNQGYQSNQYINPEEIQIDEIHNNQIVENEDKLDPYYLKNLIQDAKKWQYNPINIQQQSKTKSLKCPRKPPTGFQLFTQKQSLIRKRQKLYKGQSQKLTSKDIQLINQQWKNLNDKQKKKYIQISDNMLRKYNTIHEEYMFLEGLNKIEKPYTKFYHARYFQLQIENNLEYSSQQISKIIGKQWRQLPLEQKQCMKAQYQQQVMEYQQRMMEAIDPQRRQIYKRKLKQYTLHIKQQKQQIKIETGQLADNLDDHLKIIQKKNSKIRKIRNKKKLYRQKQAEKQEKQKMERMRQNMKIIQKIQMEEMKKFQQGEEIMLEVTPAQVARILKEKKAKRLEMIKIQRITQQQQLEQTKTSIKIQNPSVDFDKVQVSAFMGDSSSQEYELTIKDRP